MLTEDAMKKLNFVNRVDGVLQIGLLNINTGNGWLPVLPIVNGTR